MMSLMRTLTVVMTLTEKLQEPKQIFSKLVVLENFRTLTGRNKRSFRENDLKRTDRMIINMHPHSSLIYCTMLHHLVFSYQVKPGEWDSKLHHRDLFIRPIRQSWDAL